MFLKEFNSTDMQREPRKVFDAANKEPVIITRQSHDGVVMMSKKEYAKLVSVKPAEKKVSPKKSTSTTAVLFPNTNPMNGFNEFWDAYPKKKAKQEAVKAWVKQDCHKAAGMLTADVLNRAKVDPSWKEAQFIPNAATYINGKRWNDEVTKVDNRSFIQKQNDATREELFGKKGDTYEGELDD